MEKTGGAEDELDTVRKLIAGLDRAADDLSMISDYGHPVYLKTQPNVDLHAVMSGVAANVNAGLNSGPRATGSLAGPIELMSDGTPIVGEFDATALASALKSISLGALKLMNNKAREGALTINLYKPADDGNQCLIEWAVLDQRRLGYFSLIRGQRLNPNVFGGSHDRSPWWPSRMPGRSIASSSADG